MQTPSAYAGRCLLALFLVAFAVRRRVGPRHGHGSATPRASLSRARPSARSTPKRPPRRSRPPRTTRAAGRWSACASAPGVPSSTRPGSSCTVQAPRRARRRVAAPPVHPGARSGPIPGALTQNIQAADSARPPAARPGPPRSGARRLPGHPRQEPEADRRSTGDRRPLPAQGHAGNATQPRAGPCSARRRRLTTKCSRPTPTNERARAELAVHARRGSRGIRSNAEHSRPPGSAAGRLRSSSPLFFCRGRGRRGHRLVVRARVAAAPGPDRA